MTETNNEDHDSGMEVESGSESSTDELIFGKITELENDFRKGKKEFETMDTSTPGENKRTRDTANEPTQKGGIVPSQQIKEFLGRK